MNLRFGVIGTGHWASEVHLPGLAASPDAHLVGLWGREASRREALARRFGVASFASPAALLEAVDAVSFAVPPAVQAVLAPDFARAGRHLLLEKPLALATNEAGGIVDAVEAAGVAAVVFFTRRFAAPFEQEVQALEAQGPWREAEAVIQSGAMLPGTPYAESLWRQRKGALWDIGPHALAVLLPILGPVARVRAEELAAPAGVVLHLKHAGGAEAVVRLSLHADAAQLVQSYRFRRPNAEALLLPPPVQACEAYRAAVAELLDAAAIGREPRCGVHFAAGITDVLAAAGASLRAGDWRQPG